MFLIISVIFLAFSSCSSAVKGPINVTYDSCAIIINGQRRNLISGAIHYPRSTPQMWPDLIEKAKDGGIDVIETYVFWNLHAPRRKQYDFSGNLDVVKFFKLVQEGEAGMYGCLRIGPYACAEWNYGGFPCWKESSAMIVNQSVLEKILCHDCKSISIGKNPLP